MKMTTWRFATWHLLLIGLQCLALSQKTKAWQNATATWYPGRPGEGNPDGGACGYGPLSVTAYGKMVSATSSVFFQNGLGCGACFEVICKSNPLCSKKPIVVTVTDLCPGGGNPNWSGNGKAHFDMTREAFGAMATKGQEENLPNYGYMNQILYRRVACKYPQRNAQFSFQRGSSVWWIGLLLRDVGGPGTVTHVSVKTSNSNVFRPMVHNWGAVYSIQSTGDRFEGPYVILLQNRKKNQSLLCPNAIPGPYNFGEILNCGAQWTSPSSSASPPPSPFYPPPSNPPPSPPPPLFPPSLSPSPPPPSLRLAPPVSARSPSSPAPPPLRPPPPPPPSLPPPLSFPPPPPPRPHPPAPPSPYLPPPPFPSPPPSSPSPPTEEIDSKVRKIVGGPKSQSVRFQTRV